MTIKVLLGEPQEHGLNYSSIFLQRLAKDIPGSITIIQTDGTVSENDKAMASNPNVFYHPGHGSNYEFTVESRESYIDSITGERLDDFSGKIVHLLSCETGEYLGSKLVEHGAKAFLGYNEPFIFGVVEETHPEPDAGALPTNYADYYSFIDCDTEAERKFLINRTTLKQAIQASQDKFNEYIDKYLTGAWKDTYVAPYLVRFLEHDRDCQVSYGNTNIKATGEEGPPEEEEEYWDPLRRMITAVEETRPEIRVRVLEDLISKTAAHIIEYAPELKLRR